jgi:serine/threonine protein kinase
VVQLLDHVWQPKPQVLAAVFELLPGGELFDRIERHGPCTEPEAAQIARQVRWEGRGGGGVERGRDH